MILLYFFVFKLQNKKMKGFVGLRGKRLRPLGAVVAFVHHDLQRQHIQLLADERPPFLRLAAVATAEAEAEAELVVVVLLVPGLYF